MNDNGTYELYKGYELADRIEAGKVLLFKHRTCLVRYRTDTIEEAKQWIDEQEKLFVNE